MENRVFTSQEIVEIARRLETRDAVFSQLWQIGKPVFDTTIKTAAVSFDDAGQCIMLQVNPKFWAAQTDEQKDFVISHEMLHVILGHGRRAKDSGCLNQQANNVAMDVVVNELLVSGFGFDRKTVDPKNTLCWLNTIFKGRKDVLPEQVFEYYLMKFPQVSVSVMVGGGTGKLGKSQSQSGQVLDDHSKLPVDEDTSKMAEKVAAKLSGEERERFKEKLGEEGEKCEDKTSGTESGGFMKVMERVRVPRKRKWESLIKRFLKEIAGDGIEEKWFGTNRRYCAMGQSKVILPTEVDGEGKSHRRALVYMFLDTSGSCSHLAERFWRLASTVPRDTFDLRLRCFDTQVYEISFKVRKLFGFGGTSFSILERHIQKEIKVSGKYPDGVFVVTDGYGTHVLPQIPERWHVLLIDGDGGCFPSTVNCHDLNQFE